MMHYKKTIIIAVVLIFFVFSAFMIYNVNTAYPGAEEKAYRVGDVTRYKGLKLTVGNVEIYKEEELTEKYPETKSELDNDNSSIRCNYIVANITFENDTNETITFGKLDYVAYWVIETDMSGNGASLLFTKLNPDYKKSFSVGEVQKLKIIYSIPEDWTSYEKLQQVDKKIVFSYYPTKSNILYEHE